MSYNYSCINAEPVVMLNTHQYNHHHIVNAIPIHGKGGVGNVNANCSNAVVHGNLAKNVSMNNMNSRSQLHFAQFHQQPTKQIGQHHHLHHHLPPMAPTPSQQQINKINFTLNGNDESNHPNNKGTIKRQSSVPYFNDGNLISVNYHASHNTTRLTPNKVSLPASLHMMPLLSAGSTAMFNWPDTATQPSINGKQEQNSNAFCVRFAVNGLSKYALGGSSNLPLQNRNIQAGDFGDDAGMIAENSRSIVIGLADGAGGNRSIGIDPQKFSRSLLGYCVEIIKNEEILPNQMAKLACKSIQILEAQNIDGSGTLCLLALNKHNNTMHAMNIGDSGFRLIRQGQIRHKSESTMAGSSPKQLYVSESSNYNGISFVNEDEITQDSDIREFQVKKGDIIVLSSDGMFDVVQDQVIEKIVNNHNEKDLQGIADDLLQQSMRSYIHTQRDDILIMVCRIENKK